MNESLSHDAASKVVDRNLRTMTLHEKVATQVALNIKFSFIAEKSNRFSG